MENQDNQNIQPDYSFILNQPSEQPVSRPPVPGGHKSRKKLIILTICLLVILAGLTVAALLVSPKQTQTTNPASASSPFATNPVDRLLTAIKQQDYTTAAALLPGVDISRDQLAVNLEGLFTKIDLSSCKVSELQGSKNNSLSKLSCRSADNAYGIVFSFIVAEYQGSPVIATYKFEVVN